MNIFKNQQGFSAFLVVMLLVFFAAVGLAFYKVYENNKVDNTDDSSSSITKSEDSSQEQSADAPEINNSEDLDKASQALDSADIDSSSDDESLDEDLSAVSNQ